MNKIIIAAVFIVCCSATSALAASISSLIGTFSNNETVTINGSGFGTKSPVSPWLYDDFEDGTDAADVRNTVTPVGSKTWQTYNYGVDGDALTFNTVRSFNGSQSAYTEDGESGTFSGNVWIGGQATQNRYVSYRFYTATGVGGTTKFDRSTANTGNGNNNAPYDEPPNWGWGPYWFYNDGDTFYSPPSTDYVDALPSDTWNRIESWIEVGSLNTEDGVYQQWLNFNSHFNGTGLLNCDNISGCQVDTWMSLLIANNSSTYSWWYDCVYIDNTRMRVELGDDPTWSSCTERVIQVPHTTWSDTSIQITVKTGGQTGTKYLFIVASDGDPIDLNGASAGEGYAITMGESYGPTPNITGITITGGTLQ